MDKLKSYLRFECFILRYQTCVLLMEIKTQLDNGNN